MDWDILSSQILTAKRKFAVRISLKIRADRRAVNRCEQRSAKSSRMQSPQPNLLILPEDYHEAVF
jgi:hypothetical protein